MAMFSGDEVKLRDAAMNVPSIHAFPWDPSDLDLRRIGHIAAVLVLGGMLHVMRLVSLFVL